MPEEVTVPFTANGKEYEVRIGTEDGEALVRAFDKATGEPANGYIYHIDGETTAGLTDITSRDLVEALANVARQDVVDHRWEHFLKRVSKAKATAGVPPAKLT